MRKCCGAMKKVGLAVLVAIVLFLPQAAPASAQQTEPTDHFNIHYHLSGPDALAPPDSQSPPYLLPDGTLCNDFPSAPDFVNKLGCWLEYAFTTWESKDWSEEKPIVSGHGRRNHFEWSQEGCETGSKDRGHHCRLPTGNPGALTVHGQANLPPGLGLKTEATTVGCRPAIPVLWPFTAKPTCRPGSA